jgi:hypothetical protein
MADSDKTPTTEAAAKQAAKPAKPAADAARKPAAKRTARKDARKPVAKAAEPAEPEAHTATAATPAGNPNAANPFAGLLSGFAPYTGETPSIDPATLVPFWQLDEKAIAEAKKAIAEYLDAYESAALEMIDSAEKAAVATQLDWIKDAAIAQAKLSREFTKSQTSAAREALVS